MPGETAAKLRQNSRDTGRESFTVFVALACGNRVPVTRKLDWVVLSPLLHPPRPVRAFTLTLLDSLQSVLRSILDRAFRAASAILRALPLLTLGLVAAHNEQHACAVAVFRRNGVA